jgi:8-oxo-dGTP pyrophosphatase MutT (NUDIX family)
LSRLPFDPQALPIEAIAGESPLAGERLAAEWLRRRFANPQPWQPEANRELLSADAELVPAAVLMPLVMREGGLTMLFTERTAHLSAHAGQISFPGGRIEKYDASPIEAALRETEEEIGLGRGHIEVLGTLPDYVTGSRFLVTPVVALACPPFNLRPDPSEVAKIFEVPLSFLMDGANHQRRVLDLPDGTGRRSFYSMHYGGCFIWGATAGMLRSLFHFLRA